MTKIALITGITGQDGAYLAEFLLKRGYIVHGIKRRASLFNTDRIDHLYQDPHVDNRNFILHHGDLTDSTNLIRIIQQVQPDEIYNLANVPNYAVLGTQNVTVPDYTAQFIRAALRVAYRGAKLRPDTADGLPPRIPRVVTPSIVRAFIAQILQSLEDRGILINVAANLSLLVVEINATNSSRLDCEIPAAVIPGLDIIAGNVRQL